MTDKKIKFTDISIITRKMAARDLKSMFSLERAFNEQSSVIEAILLGLPMPSIISCNQQGFWKIHHGLATVSAVLSFMDGQWSVDPKDFKTNLPAKGYISDLSPSQKRTITEVLFDVHFISPCDNLDYLPVIDLLKETIQEKQY